MHLFMLVYCLSIKKFQEAQKRVTRRSSFVDSVSENGNHVKWQVFIGRLEYISKHTN
jgi:hypothetical protein